MKKPLSMSLLFFTGIAAIADSIGVVFLNLQVVAAVPATIGAAGGTLVKVAGEIVSNLGEGANKVLNRLFNIEIGVIEEVGETIEKAGEVIIGASLGVYTLHFVISLIVLCIFLSIVLATPKGSYTLLDCIIGLLIFFVESLPFVGGFTFWTFFVWFLRVREIPKMLLKN